jgi:hypothetical protein
MPIIWFDIGLDERNDGGYNRILGCHSKEIGACGCGHRYIPFVIIGAFVFGEEWKDWYDLRQGDLGELPWFDFGLLTVVQSLYIVSLSITVARAIDVPIEFLQSIPLLPHKLWAKTRWP